eukprot:gene3637-5639_t
MSNVPAVRLDDRVTVRLAAAYRGLCKRNGISVSSTGSTDRPAAERIVAYHGMPFFENVDRHGFFATYQSARKRGCTMEVCEEQGERHRATSVVTNEVRLKDARPQLPMPEHEVGYTGPHAIRGSDGDAAHRRACTL